MIVGVLKNGSWKRTTKLRIETSLMQLFLKTNPFLDMGAENSSEEIDVKNKDVQDIEHEGLKENIVRCSECKKVLPNDHKAIKHHMINEHIKPKQKSVVIDATPKNDHLTKPNNRYQISLNMSLRHEGAENITLGSQASDLCF